MSHHLDSPLARQDVRLDITDVYRFWGTTGTVFSTSTHNSIDGFIASVVDATARSGRIACTACEGEAMEIP